MNQENTTKQGLTPEEEEELVPKSESISVLSKLWEKVFLLEQQNRQLAAASDHFRNLIGS